MHHFTDIAKRQLLFMTATLIMSTLPTLLPAILDKSGAAGAEESVPREKKHDLGGYTIVLGVSSKKPRVIDFPKDYSLGEIEISNWPASEKSPEMRGAARGKTVVPAGKMSRFEPGHRFYANPAIIDTLPPVAFDSILLAASSLADSEDGLCDRALTHIGHLKGLLELDLDRSDATDIGAAHAADLPELQRITAFSTNLEGKCFKQFAGLKHLRQLRLPRDPIKDDNLQYLAAMPQLQFLNLTGCNISDAGVKHLTKCLPLISLNISDNPLITDKSIQYFHQIKNLRYLVLANTSITAAGALQLRGLPLEGIELPAMRCTAQQLQELHKAFPALTFSKGRHKVKAIDSETKTLFAPLH